MPWPFDAAGREDLEEDDLSDATEEVCLLFFNFIFRSWTQARTKKPKRIIQKESTRNRQSRRGKEMD